MHVGSEYEIKTLAGAKQGHRFNSQWRLLDMISFTTLGRLNLCIRCAVQFFLLFCMKF